MAEYLDDSIDFSLYLRETDAQTKVKPARAWSEDLKARLRAKAITKKIYLPWEKTNDSFHFRPGEVSLWSGQNGHGKSLVLSQVALSLMGQEQRVCIASFEMKPAETLQRMARMNCGMNPFSPEFQGDSGIAALDELYDDFFGWTDHKLWLYDQMGTAEAKTVVGMARYCAKELKMNHIIVDNLAKCVRDEDDYNAQKSFIDDLTAVARDHSVHIHVAHHLKKPAKEGDVPDKHDNKGTGAITDLVDNIFMVWRNKPKEDDVKANSSMAKKMGEPDQFLLCRKQRNYDGSGEGEPTIKLWFHRDAQQYVAEPHDPPQFFQNYPHRATPGNY